MSPRSKRRLALLSLMLAMGMLGCAHISLPALPHPAAKPVVIARCPGAYSADLQAQPQPLAAAGMVRAQTQAESDAQAATLQWIHDLAAWGRTGWSRVGDVRAWCLTPPSS